MYYEIVPMDRGHVDQIAELERQNAHQLLIHQKIYSAP